MRQPQTFDNINNTVKDNLAETLQKGDKLSIAAATFSIYAYEALKDSLNGIDELRFIFTSPTFLKDKAPKKNASSISPNYRANARFTAPNLN